MVFLLFRGRSGTHARPPLPGVDVISALVVLQAPSLLLILLVAFFRNNEQSRREDFLTVLIFLLYGFYGVGMQIFVAHHFAAHDPTLLAADQFLGFPTLAVWHWVTSHYMISAVLALTYGLLPWMISLTWIFEQNPVMRIACAVAGVLCFAGYAAMPAVGPRYYWVLHPLTDSARNCMPSMHLTWALILAIAAQKRWWKITTGVFAVLTACATIGCGQHYLVDLLAAIPFTLGVWWFSQRIQDVISARARGLTQDSPEQIPVPVVAFGNDLP